MNTNEWLDVKMFVKDHYEHFGAYPGEVETSEGRVFTYEEYQHHIDF